MAAQLERCKLIHPCSSTNLASVWSLDGSYSTSVVILSVRGLMTTVAPTGFLYGAAMSLVITEYQN